VLRENDYLLKFAIDSLLRSLVGVNSFQSRYSWDWIIAKIWKQSRVGWFLESLQKTWSFFYSYSFYL